MYIKLTLNQHNYKQNIFKTLPTTQSLYRAIAPLYSSSRPRPASAPRHAGALSACVATEVLRKCRRDLGFFLAGENKEMIDD